LLLCSRRCAVLALVSTLMHTPVAKISDASDPHTEHCTVLIIAERSHGRWYGGSRPPRPGMNISALHATDTSVQQMLSWEELVQIIVQSDAAAITSLRLSTTGSVCAGGCLCLCSFSIRTCSKNVAQYQ
jgi:hypothetical protein